MKIYSKGITEENIDYIVERKLKAIISSKYAIVTIAEDGRTLDDLRVYLNVSEEIEEDCVHIYFSPEMIVPDMQYVLIAESKREYYNELIKEFEQSFFDFIIKMAEKSENLTRAEVIRLVWQKFSSEKTIPYDNVDVMELKQLLAQVESVKDDEWINDKFVELIFKYAIYLTCWEKGYGWLASGRYKAAHLGERQKKQDKWADSMAHENTVNNWFKCLFSGEINSSTENIPKDIKDVFQRGVSIEVTRNIEKRIYEQCKLQMDESIEVYRKYFYKSHDAKERNLVKVTLYELILFTNCFGYGWWMQCKKEDIFKFLLDDSEHIGDISDVIESNTMAAVEIVLMNTAKINQNLVQDKSWADMSVVASANKLQLYVIPAALVLLKYNEYKDDIPVDEMMMRLDEDEEIKESVKKKFEKKVKDLKGKDKGTILGNFHIFASENIAIIDALKKEESSRANGLVKRSKNQERNYWGQRIKSLKKVEIVENDIVAKNLLKKFLEYLRCQNNTLRDFIREAIAPQMLKNLE